MGITELYDIAQEHNIEVIQFPAKENGSVSVTLGDGRYFIGIDKSVQDGGAIERIHLGHEIGHCITGSFYNPYAAMDIRQKHENRADKWAIQNLVPVEDLDEALGDGCTEIWELAERFGVTEDFMKKAICYYSHGNVAAELYF